MELVTRPRMREGDIRRDVLRHAAFEVIVEDAARIPQRPTWVDSELPTRRQLAAREHGAGDRGLKAAQAIGVVRGRCAVDVLTNLDPLLRAFAGRGSADHHSGDRNDANRSRNSPHFATIPAVGADARGMIAPCRLRRHTFRVACKDARGSRAGGAIAVLGSLCAERRPIVATDGYHDA